MTANFAFFRLELNVVIAFIACHVLEPLASCREQILTIAYFPGNAEIYF